MISHEFKWHRSKKIDNTIAFYLNDSRMTGELKELHLLRGGDGDRIVCVDGVMSGHPTILFP
jgi:hypothetical protein